jgi:hypothetical protein
MKTKIPPYVQSALWSYDLEKLDLHQDKERIITNVLNHGTKQSTDWLLQTYSKQDISDVIASPRPGEWNKKSLNFWSIIFNITPRSRNRFPV